MRIMITGSAGRMGRSLYAELRSRGHAVAGIDVAASPINCDIYCDLVDAKAVYDVVAKVKPHAIVHLAGLPTPFSHSEQILFATNTQTTFNICQAAAELEVECVLCASSPTVIGYGNPAGWSPAYLPLDEAHPVRPWHGYSMSKVAVEAIVNGFAAQSGDETRYFSFRPCYVVSPEEWLPDAPTQLGHTMAARLRDPKLAAVSLFNYIDARDAASLAAMICEQHQSIPNGECFFASAADALATKPLSELLPRYVPSTAPFASSLSGQQSAFSSEKASHLLGWKPTRSWRNFINPGVL